jgi:uncharacterized phiE125 gp8 family phage protein
MPVDAAVALVTLAQAKTQLKITGSSEDTFLESLVNRASEKAKKYCGRNFITDDFVEFYDGTGEDFIIVRNYPIISLTSLYDDPLRLFGADTQISIASDVLLDPGPGIIRLWNQRNFFIRGKANVRVSYSGGYEDDTVPYDLQEAVLTMIVHAYRRLYQDQRIGLVSETIGDRNQTFAREAIPKEAEEILKKYRYFGSATFGY